jgi:hypothetical protein
VTFCCSLLSVYIAVDAIMQFGHDDLMNTDAAIVALLAVSSVLHAIAATQWSRGRHIVAATANVLGLVAGIGGVAAVYYWTLVSFSG